MARGREAEGPTEIPAKGWKDIALRVKDEVSEDRVSLIAAGIAFYGLLAIFPGIGALMAVAGLVLDPQTVVDQLSELGNALPPEAAAIVIDQAQDVASAESGGLGIAALIGLALALWSASAGVSSLMEGMNVAYDEQDKRGFLWRTVLRLLLTLGLIAGLIAIVFAAIVLPLILQFLVGIGPVAYWSIAILRWSLIFALVVGMLSVLYRYGPDRRGAQWRWLTPGALLATGLWIVASLGFALYVRSFAGYQETFGALAGVIILLMWLWISSFVILLGAEINSEMEAQTAEDTTTDPHKPMGARGAVKADTVGEART